MKPVRVRIDGEGKSSLDLQAIKYVFRTILTLAGLPWCFSGKDSSDQIDIYYGRSAPAKRSCRLFIQLDEIDIRRIDEPSRVIEENGDIYFLFRGNTRNEDIVVHGENEIRLNNDIIISSYYLLTGAQEKQIRRDEKGNHDITNSYYYRSKTLHRAIVDRYAKLIRSIFVSHDPQPRWPGGAKHALALTHDVDYPEMIKWIEVVRFIIKHKLKASPGSIIDILNGSNNFWKFSDWMKLEERYGFKSAFYFCAIAGSLAGYYFKSPDPFYNIASDKFRELFSSLHDNGFEIGMHASFLAHRSAPGFKDEKDKLESAVGGVIKGNRHHYWRMNHDRPYETARIHDATGLIYDCSICFERRAGFRYGISAPFHLYDPEAGAPVKSLQIPTVLMDDHLFGYSHLSYIGGWRDELEALLKETRDVGGVFVADYHVRVLNDTFFPGWGNSYRYLLDAVAANSDCYVDTPANIASNWIDFEKRIRSVSMDEMND